QFSKLDSVNLKKLVEEVMDEIGHRLEDQGISFEITISDDVFAKNVNYDLLFQLFYNLINNAIRYNKPQGSISIDESKGSNYSVEIKDTGIGIPQEEIPLIFNRFKKANLAQTGGYGLGLSIVKSIANYHHLKLNVNSVVDDGTEFSVVFPKDGIEY
ncbi:MAG: HAMP domain-containing histidine kinase, partial [Pyrinomonadaceae bacterium]|nr:HAMP domain-containing histidine kinase [Sphingobacteriaceae bacterium]